VIKNRVHETVITIQLLKAKKIVWGGFDDDKVFIVSADGIHSKIQEVRTDPSAK
jgi:hypothetical protein